MPTYPWFGRYFFAIKFQDESSVQMFIVCPSLSCLLQEGAVGTSQVRSSPEIASVLHICLSQVLLQE